MTNTTDMIITCFDEKDVVAEISRITGIDFLKISDSEKCGGPKILCFDAFGACYMCLGKEKIDEIIAVFKVAEFLWPELATLTIDDDNDIYSGVILREPIT